MEEASPPLKATAPINYKKGAFRSALVQAAQALDSESQAPEGSTLVQIAGQLLRDAVTGDSDAIRQIADRLDGRPAQALEVTGEDGGPLQIADVSDFEIAKRIAFLLSRGINLLPPTNTEEKVLEHG